MHVCMRVAQSKHKQFDIRLFDIASIICELLSAYHSTIFYQYNIMLPFGMGCTNRELQSNALNLTFFDIKATVCHTLTTTDTTNLLFEA